MKKKRLFICLMLVVLAVFGVACSARTDYGTNFLQNGDFVRELEGWSQYAENQSAVTVTDDSFELGGTDYYFVMIENAELTHSALRQTVKVERGETYEISVFIGGVAGKSFTSEQGNMGAYLSVLELSGVTTCVDSSFNTKYPLLSGNGSSADWTLFRLFVTIDNVDEITIELSCGAKDNFAKGAARFRNAEIKKVKMDPSLQAYAKISEVSHDVTREGGINPWGFVAVVLLGLGFAAAAFFTYEYIASQLKKKKPAEAAVKDETPSPKKKTLSKEWKILLIALGAVFVLKLVLAGLLYGHEEGFRVLAVSAKQIGKEGLGSFYTTNPQSTLAPGSLYILSFLGLFTQNLAHGAFMEMMLIRLPAVIADIASSILIFVILQRSLKNQRVALAGALLYAVNAATFALSVWWGQYDSILAALLLLCIYLMLTKKYIWSCLSFAAALLFGVQVIFVAPIFVAYLVISFVKNRDKRLSIGIGAGGAVLLWFLLTLPVAANHMRGGEFFFIIKQYGEILRANVFTQDAFSFFGILGRNNVEIANPLLASWLTAVMYFLLSAVLILLLVKYKGKGNIILLLSAALMAGICTFGANMAVHFIFPVIILTFVAALVIGDRRLFFVSVIYSLVQFLSATGLLLSHQKDYTADSALMVTGSILSVLLFVYLAIIMIDILLQDKIKPIRNYTNIFK